MKLGLAEILQQAENIEGREQKIMFLRKNDSQPLRKILEFAFDKRIQWDIPDGKPPYRPCDFLDQEGMLYKEMKRMYLFLKGGNPSLSQAKRENLFIQLLESIPQADAELLCAVKDHTMPYNVPEEVVREAFPDLLLFPMQEERHLTNEEQKVMDKALKKSARVKDPTFTQRMKEAREKKKLEKEKNVTNG